MYSVDMKRMSTILRTTKLTPVNNVGEYYERTGNEVRACALTAIVMENIPNVELTGFAGILINNEYRNIPDWIAKKYKCSEREAFAISDTFCKTRSFEAAGEVASWIEAGVPIEEVEEIVRELPYT